MLYTNSLVRDVTSVMLVSLLAIFQQGLRSTRLANAICYLISWSWSWSTFQWIKIHTDFKHLKQSKTSQKNSPNCFEILDTTRSPILLKLKEAFYINNLKPELNVQLKRMKTAFVFLLLVYLVNWLLSLTFYFN